MIYYIYDGFEKDYHELTSTSCDCAPDIRFPASGDMLIVHNCLVKPDKKYTEDQVQKAIALIMEQNV